jgi:hypothetical protein
MAFALTFNLLYSLRKVRRGLKSLFRGLPTRTLRQV